MDPLTLVEVIFGTASAIIKLYKAWGAWKDIPERFQKLLGLLGNVADKILVVRTMRHAYRERTSHSQRLNMMANERSARILVEKLNAKFKSYVDVAESSKKMLLCQRFQSWIEKETHSEAILDLRHAENLLNIDISGGGNGNRYN
ncbi:hypothetical protein RB595_008915 [Gaeumannomyces hyphopodioides]